MHRYLHEVDKEAVVRAFPSSKEFEKFYFRDLLTPPQKNEEDWNPLATLSDDDTLPLRQAPFSKSKPFDGSELTLEVKVSDFSVVNCSQTAGQVFGHAIEEILKSDFKLGQLIPESMDKLQKDLSQLRQKGRHLFVARSGQKKNELDEVWAFLAEVQPLGDSLKVKFKLRNDETLKALGRENEVSGEQKGLILPIDVCFYNNDCIHDENKLLWVTKVATLLKKANLWPIDNRPKFVALRHDHDEKEKVSYQHPLIDDLICLPLDRLIFLQKTDIALNTPKKVEPRFLFVQEANETVDIAKACIIDEYSDVGFAIRNPVALKAGTLAKFYFRFPGETQYFDTYGKVLFCVNHPQIENSVLVHFAFFGLGKLAFKAIRSHLSQDSGYKLLLNQEPKDFEYNPDNIFITDEEKTPKTVAIVEHDELVLANTAANIKKELNNCNVIQDTSYSSFYRKYLAAKNGKAEEAPPATEADFYDQSVSFLVDPISLNFQMALTPPDEGQTILGHPAEELFDGPSNWHKLFDNEFSNDLLTECFRLIVSTRRLKKVFELNTLEEGRRSVDVEMVLEDNDQLVRFSLAPPAHIRPSSGTQELDQLDVLVIDESLLPNDADAFLTSLNNSAAARGIKTPKGGTKVIVLSTDFTEERILHFKKKQFFGAIVKPIETRRLMFLISQAAKSPFTMYNFDNIGRKEGPLKGRMAKSGELTQLSEFGATIKLPHRLRVGSMMYLFGSIYDNAPDGNLCCRVYHTEPTSGEDGYFDNYVLYFGIHDAFLKFTRAHIREAYVNKKSGS